MISIKKQTIIFNKTTILVLLFALHSLLIVSQKSNWKIDTNHTKIGFEITYFKIGNIKGVFDKYSGSFIQEDGKISSVTITIETNSINTNQSNRDKHLISKDFFDATQHPNITFVSTNIRKTGEKEYEIEGNFTMTGITKSIVLKAIDKGTFIHPRFKNNNKFLTITGVIKREEFNVGTNYPPAKFALGQDVKLTAEVNLVEEK
ncbi:YceI family protein [Polaribacter porphyrae]|uniref:Lipid/polyisoprenoid-binding YceI-like domain-containing protein n=1 Tax=Polaribacter porphyrae TaxID=1137780 RepID=A0A2S7WS57_9FLAO|nr:YceI family protein [Polaribacter porphyrae]PQJ80152.1 hypothetical protein BTO18_13635 [Polaribacter porphyrae]